MRQGPVLHPSHSPTLCPTKGLTLWSSPGTREPPSHHAPGSRHPLANPSAFLAKEGKDQMTPKQHKQGSQRMRACALNPLLSINNWEKDTTGTQTLCIFQTELNPTDRWGQTAASRCLCYCQLESSGRGTKQGTSQTVPGSQDRGVMMARRVLAWPFLHASLSCCRPQCYHPQDTLPRHVSPTVPDPYCYTWVHQEFRCQPRPQPVTEMHNLRCQGPVT